MSKLTDTHLVILAAAADRPGGAVLPLPASLSLRGAAVGAVLGRLAKAGLIAEVGDPDQPPSKDAFVITDVGRAAIEGADAGAGPETSTEAVDAPAEEAASRNDASVRPGTKLAALVDLLARSDGATVAEIAAETGWQAHSVRGAISGAVKKKLGLAVASEKVEGRGRVYRIAG